MKMKKNNLLILAVAALGFAACSSDETTAVNEKLAESNAISFRTSVAGNMRAAILTTSNLNSFKVTALNNKTETPYFAWDVFTKNEEGYFVSADKHYWPASGKLDFYAYSPTSVSYGTLTPSNYRTFSFSPADAAENQVDFIYAATKAKQKSTDANGVVLNFRHACSQIVIKVKNSSNNLKFNISNCKLAFLNNSATFTAPIQYDDDASKTDTQYKSDGSSGGESDLFNSGWGSITGKAKEVAYTATNTQYVAPSQDVTLYGDEHQAMILIPQTITAASAYSSNKPNSTYIALKMEIRNNDGATAGAGTLIADATVDGNWAFWPIPSITWQPGKKYTYTIDLAGGGFWETNDVTVNPGTDVFDPVLSDAEIKFVTVTVDDWFDAPQGVIYANYAFENSTTKVLGTAPATAANYTFKVSGLVSGETVSIGSKTGDFASAAVTVSPGTVGTDGIVTVSASLPAGNTATSEFVLTGSTSGSMTFQVNR